MIPYFIPDMPKTEALIPYLKEIDNNLWYSNFGPLYHQLIQKIADNCLDNIATNKLTLVSSGTSAIELALRSLNLPAGAKVLTTSFTFPATVEAIINAGLTPVLSDINKNNWFLTPEIALRNTKLHNIAAVVPVAAFGMPVCSESWANFYKKTNLPVVIDAAAALMNQSINENLIYAFSLHATKPLGAGEGGLVVCPNKSQASFIRKMSNFGFEAGRTINNVGTNAKMSEYHCAVGLAQLDRIKEIKQKNSFILNKYKSLFEQHHLKVQTQAGLESFVPASLYVLFEHHTDELFERLLEQGIESRRLYWPLIQGFPAFSDNTIPASLNFKNANRVSSQGLALPFHNHLTEQDIENTVSILSTVLNKKAQQL
ncbi:DegT/DnrJ/EryC1/StrS family aminotransferase [Alkalimarinus alittae]|uniref:DegT/DnrJ/EryC1/StrS family aminotransferase n=1 Tax=Alkalimarinus alittae TaxID=2961619 RepID=A0ABY6N6D1_9ALTE|nr:DegT/DnrJ/EryC1/StrS family aminotransferase [Alkalimarinus alittae]UZE97549.1 DegT/DnrJ/EryC1/StrS family aminotransferase [Alkalimarinus alittae]